MRPGRRQFEPRGTLRHDGATMHAKPNIVMMVADDHRHHAVGAYGIENVHTPTLDALVAAGISFRQNRHTGSWSAAVCIAARASLHTGRHAMNHQPILGRYEANAAHRDIDEHLVTLGQTLREAGYDAFATGKWHNDGKSFNRSFDDGRALFFAGMSDHVDMPVQDYDPTGAYPPDRAKSRGIFSSELFAGEAIDYLQQRDRDKPFFLYVAFTSPHDPRMAPEPFASMYDPADIQLPPNFLPEHPFDLGDYHIRDEELAAFPRSESEVRRHISDYYAMITHQDHHMGRIIDALRDTGQYDNTIIIYTADHGLSVGQHGLLGKQNLYEHAVRVPMIVAGPDLPRDKTIHAMTLTMDLYPTLCELVGAAVPDDVQAQSLLPLINDRDDEIRAHVGCFYRMYQRMITDGRWKLIQYHVHGGESCERKQLFDLAVDPWEMHDLAADPMHRSRVDTLGSALRQWQQDRGDPWTTGR
jgi:arylsulfatase A-like enzyme